MTVELGGGAFLLVTFTALVSGLLSAWTFKRFSDGPKLRSAINHVIAHLFELQLFSDEPALVLRAQRRLIAANGRFLWQTLRPSLILLPPFALVLLALEASFACAPLQVDRPAVVTLHGTDVQQRWRLSPPDGFRVETTPLRVPPEREISWRLRPVTAAHGQLIAVSSIGVVQTTIASGRGMVIRLTFPHLSRSWIDVQYPEAQVWNQSWLLWFTVGCVTGALLYSVRLRMF